ncbi:MAG: type-F conjugative transfer system secretin TraK [Pseudomonadota bacterium]
MLLFLLNAALMMNVNQKIPVVFSSTDINRLSIKNGRIKNVFGADLFLVEKDEETGQIFLQVKEDQHFPLEKVGSVKQ